MIFKALDCNYNYAVLSDEERQKFVKRYSALFNRGIPFKVVLTPEKANNDFGTGYRNIYFSCEDEASWAVADMLSSIGTGYTKIPENEFAPILRFKSKYRDYAECSLWNKDVSDRLLTSLCSIFDSASSSVIVTFDPLSSKEKNEYLIKKIVKYARHNGSEKTVSKIRSYLASGKKLYRIRLKVITAGDTQEQAKAFMDLLIDKADEFGCKLHRPSEKKSVQIKRLAKKLLHDDKYSKICAEKTCAKFVPFFSAEVNDNSETAFDYGVNQITKNQLLYDRKNSKLANGIVFGMSGGGKTVYVKNEILQVLDKTEDDIIILDPNDTFGYTYDEFQDELIRIDEFQGKLTRISNFCINPLDIVIDTFDGMTETIAEKANFITELLKLLLPYKYRYEQNFNKHETKLIFDAVYQVLTPFVNKLKKNYDGESACVYDFENNPTLKDVLDIILSQDNEETQELREVLTAQMPYLEAFCHKTMTFGNRVIFDLYHVPCKLTAAYYMVIVSYTNNRMLLNHYEQFNAPDSQFKHLWFYFDEANRMLKNKDFADFVRMLYQRSHRYGMICTAVVQSLSELIKTEQGQAIFNNSGFRVFLAQSVLDRMLTKETLNVSDEMLNFTNDPPIGSGIFYNCREMIPFHS